MSIRLDENFDKERIISYLKSLNNDVAYWFIPFVEFVFTDYGNNLFNEINSRFRSVRGSPAIDRRKLFLGLIYAIKFEIDYDLAKVALLGHTDKILSFIMGDDRPCSVTYNNFLTQTDSHILKKLSVCTLMELNDLEFIDFRRMYTDSTDAKINGSVHYKVNKDDVEGLKLMNKLGLLHNRSIKKMKKNKRKLLEIKDALNDSEEMVEIIDHVLKNFKLYDRRVYDKLNKIEQYLVDDPESEICIMFPESKLMKSKRGKFDFALLVQSTMFENGILMNSLVQSEPNDSKALEEIITDIEDTFKILLDLQIMYGERSNYKEIYDALKFAIHILDSGYFTDVNLESAHFHNMNVLIMPRNIARYNNDKLRGEIPETVNEFKQNNKKITMRQMKRTYDGYVCLNNIQSNLIDCIEPNSKFNRERQDLDDVCKEKIFIFHTDCPCDCPFKDFCNKQDFKVKVSLLKHRMFNKFTLPKFLEIYSKRFGANEQINGYFKKDKGMLKLAGSNKQATQNHLYIKMITYNVRRKVKLKGTVY